MINVPLKSIDKAVIEALVLNETPESTTLDYKQALPKSGSEDRKEFLADVTAFANAAGGDLVYGVTEGRKDNRPSGIPEEATGLAGVNADQEILRLSNVIRDGVEPRINGVDFQPVNGFPAGPVIVLRVPKSWAAPHMVKTGDSRFYSRDSRGKYPLDVAQIRSAFAFSEAMPERVRRWRDERVARIMAGEMPIPLPAGKPKIVLHLLPVGALDPTRQVDTTELQFKTDRLLPMNTAACGCRHNFDGFLTYSGSSRSAVWTYLQFFRSGAIEAVEAEILSQNDDGAKGPLRVPSISLERGLIEALTRFLKIEQEILGMEPPVFVMPTLIGVKGSQLVSRWIHHDAPHPIDRDTLFLPDAVAESFDEPADKLLQPAFDALWQASGYERCRHYENGKWKGR